MDTPHKILKEYWGYNDFRPLQEDIISSVLAGKDTLALLPTGGGKSICFQVPAMAMDGVCLVITPLIALMKDQVENLRKKGIHASAIYSGMNSHEMGVVFDNAMYGSLKFLYLSPERLETERFLEILPRIQVCLLAVDEAHCISQWGYDFRPPYLQIARIRPYIPDVPVMALTATATPQVVEDIQERLKFKQINLFQKSFSRPNLTYSVRYEEDKMGRLLKIFKKMPGCAIVYVRNRRRTREIAQYLNKNGVSAGFYHAGLDQKSRDRRQEHWMRDEKRVMVATNAFGMGIDKPNVRLVIHMDLPDSQEAYFQEAGRGGRDLKQAYAVLLYDNADIEEARGRIEMEFPDLTTIRNVYRALGNYFNLAVGSGRDKVYDFEIAHFSSQYNFKPYIAYSALKLLEKDGYVLLSDNFGESSRLMITSTREQLYRAQVSDPEMDRFIKLILRSYSGVFTEFTSISEELLSNRGRYQMHEVTSMLLQLHKKEVLVYIPRKTKPQLTFACERLDERHIMLSKEHYNLRRRRAMERMQSVIHYVMSASRCRQQILLDYFGETLESACGHCDVCRSKKKEDGRGDDIQKQLRNQWNPLLSRAEGASLDDLVDAAKPVPADDVVEVVRWLLDRKSIVVNESQFKWGQKAQD